MRFIMSVLVLSLVLSLAPAYSQNAKPAAQDEYPQLKDVYLTSVQQILDVMKSEPAQQNVNAIQAALSDITTLESDFWTAKSSGADAATLQSCAVKYFRLVDKILGQHNELQGRVEELAATASMALQLMAKDYPDRMRGDMALFQQKSDEAKAALQPLKLGVDRVQELVQVAREKIAAWKAAHPGEIVTDAVLEQQLIAASLSILEQRTK